MWRRLPILIEHAAAVGHDRSNLSDKSVVNITGAWLTPSRWASGTVPAAAPSLGCHCNAPAGLRVCSHSKANRLARYIIDHWVGVAVHAPSSPDVTVSSALPLPQVFFQPKPCSTIDLGVGVGAHKATGELVALHDVHQPGIVFGLADTES